MLRSGLAVHALPQTFQDAASVCQKLGFRYLWIDSLCISQDNLTDWASEARQMKEIYSNAVFTIAATASQDGRGGLFRHRSAGLMPPVLVEVTELNDLLPDKEMPYLSGTDTYLAGCTSNAVLDITMAPLNTRAWVIQERYLSTRTMHFSENLLYWECQESFVNELYPTELPSAGQGFDMIDIRPSKTMKLFYAGSACVPKKSEPDKDCLDNSWRERDELIYNNWTSLRTAYSMCKLTRESDLLVALAGIAQEVAGTFCENGSISPQHEITHSMSDVFIAGMWRHRFHEELCWTISPGPSEASRPDKWRAPTWSWASSTLMIQSSGKGIFENCISSLTGRLGQITEAMDILDVHVESAPSGAVTDGFISLGCRPISLTVIPTDLIDNSRHWGLMLFSNETAEHNSRGPVFVNTDEPLPDATKGYRHGVVAVSIFCCRNDDSELKWVEGLVLKPSATQPDAYERIGHFYTGGDPDCRHGAQRVWTQHERANYRVIRVV